MSAPACSAGLVRRSVPALSPLRSRTGRAGVGTTSSSHVDRRHVSSGLPAPSLLSAWPSVRMERTAWSPSEGRRGTTTAVTLKSRLADTGRLHSMAGRTSWCSRAFPPGRTRRAFRIDINERYGENRRRFRDTRASDAVDVRIEYFVVEPFETPRLLERHRPPRRSNARSESLSCAISTSGPEAAMSRCRPRVTVESHLPRAAVHVHAHVNAVGVTCGVRPRAAQGHHGVIGQSNANSPVTFDEFHELFLSFPLMRGK
jgi:hypothetical protein